jgi:hypothetical protein
MGRGLQKEGVDVPSLVCIVLSSRCTQF